MAGTEVGSIFVKIGADIKDLDKGINDSVDGLKKLTDAEIQASKESKETAENLKKLADRAMVDNLKDMASALGGFSSVILDFGKGAMEQALNIGGLENAIVRLSGSAAEGQKTVDFIKNLALTEQEFSTESLLKAGEKLTQFSTNIKELGLTVEDILPKVADFADVQMVDVADASAVVAKALSGTRGGITALGAQYGITTEKLIEYGAAVNASGEIEDDAIESKRAVIKVLDEFSGRAAIGAQSASEQYENSLTQLSNTFTELKVEIGQEVIPVIIDLAKSGTEVLKWIEELDPETKKTALTFTAWAGGIALAGQGVTGFLAAAAPFKVVMDSLGAKILSASGATSTLGASMGALGPVLPIVAVGALIVALGTLAHQTLEYQKTITQLQKTDLESSLKSQANALNALQAIYPQATTSALGFQAVIKEGIDNILKQADGLFKLNTVLKSLAKDELVHTSNLNEYQKKLKEVNKEIAATAGTKLGEYDKARFAEEKADLEWKIKQEQAYIAEKRKEKQVIYDAQKGHQEEKKAIEEKVEKQKVSTEAMKAYWKAYETISINEKKTAAEKIQTLKDLMEQYNLNDEQRAAVNKEIEAQEAKITAYLKSQNKERVKDEQEVYKEKLKQYNEYTALQEQEKQKRIAAGQYVIELEKQEEERNKTYREQLNNLKLQNDQYNEMLDKSTQLYESNLNTLNAYNDILVKRGQKTQEAADKEAESYKKAYSNAWNNTIEPIMDKVRTKGISSLSEYERKVLETGNRYIEVNKEVEKLSFNTSKVEKNTDNTADSVNKMTSGFQGANQEAEKLQKTMATMGNITAEKGGGTPSGMGEFMTPEEAFSAGSKAGTTETYGHLDNYSNAVKESMTRQTSGGGIYGSGGSNPYSYLNAALDTKNPYAGQGLGTMQPSTAPVSKTTNIYLSNQKLSADASVSDASDTLIKRTDRYSV